MNHIHRLVLRMLSGIVDYQARRLSRKRLASVIEHLSKEAYMVAQVPGGELIFHTPSQVLVSRAGSLLTKEEDTIEWINGFAENAVFWDVGANVGVYSLYAAKRRGVSVFAFEPLAANYFILCKNIQLNGLSESIRALCLAFAADSCLGALNTPAPTMGTSISQFGVVGALSPYYTGGNHVETQAMVGFSIDKFLEEFAPSFPQYLKVDVDGIELAILSGARRMLRDSRLKSVMVELNVSSAVDYSEATALIEASGFRLSGKGAQQGTETAIAINHLFVRA